MAEASTATASSEAILIGEDLLDVGRESGAALRLLHGTVSRRHATLQRRDGRFVVTDLDSRFGTRLNGVRIRTAEAVAGDKLQFGAASPFRVTEAGLVSDAAAGGLTLRADQLQVAAGGRTLVADLSFAISADAFVGILGPSGSGKSTLLKCLTGQSAPSQGRLWYDDGQDAARHGAEYQAQLGYVPQRDILYPTLSARENLGFAAELRLDAGLTSTSRQKIVQNVLEQVGLAPHAETSAQLLSGGQQKRLSVALELLRKPRLLLLDEPTSGLDPASETHLMEQLRSIARRGTSVICNTHLMDSLHLLDTVIVLGKIAGVGRLAYVGRPQQLLEHFECRSFADLYELLAEGKFEPIASRVGEPEPDEAQKSSANASNPITPVGLEWAAEHLQASTAKLSEAFVSESVRRQSWTVLRRELLLLSRDRMLGAMFFAQPLVLGAIVCLTQYGVNYATSLYLLSVVLAIWFGLNGSARDLVRQRPQYVRDRLGGLPAVGYLGAKLSFFLIVGLAQLILLLFILRLGVWLVLGDRQPRELSALWSLFWLAVLMLSYLGGLGLGFLISTFARSEESAVAAIPLLIIPQLLLSVVALGEANNGYGENRPLRPLAITLSSPVTAVDGDSKLSRWALAVDVLSLPLYSRPATLALDGAPTRIPKPYGGWIWVLDFMHLGMLVLATWIVVYFAFVGLEASWPRQIGY